MIPLKRGHLIINNKNGKYIFTDSANWDGDWRKNYPHVADLNYMDIDVPSIWEHDVVNGLPFVYDLTRDGGLFALYADQDSTAEQVEQAKAQLRRDRDVVSLRVVRLQAIK